MRTIQLLSLLVLALVMISSAKADPCATAKEETKFQTLLNNLQTNCDDNSIKSFLTTYLEQTKTQSFSSNQLVRLFKIFNTKDIYMLLNKFDMIMNHVMLMETIECAAVIQSVGNPYTRLQFLGKVVDYCKGVEIRQNKYKLYAAVSFYPDCVVYPYFDNYSVKQCGNEPTPTEPTPTEPTPTEPTTEVDPDLDLIFGELKGNNIVFVLDVSGSMDTTFYNDQAQENQKRLDYMKDQMEDYIDSLKSNQNFSIVTFNNNVGQWASTLQPASSANKLSAKNYINSKAANGSTKISGALDRAYSMSTNIDTIYLLTDGFPNRGIQGKEDIKNHLIQVNNQRTKPAPVFSVSFMIGSDNEADKVKSREYLEGVKAGTNGFLRVFT